MKRHRHRNWNVDPDHAHLHALGEIARCIAIAREHRDAVAVVILVDQLYGLLVVASAHDTEHRTEDLFPVDGHVLADVIEERRAEEKSRLARDRCFAAVHQERRALGHALLDVRGDSLAMLFGNDRSHVGFGIGSGADAQ